MKRGRGKRSFSSGAIKKVSESNEEQNEGQDTDEVGGRGDRGGGRRGGGRKKHFLACVIDMNLYIVL